MVLRRDFGTVTGKCPICTINLWTSTGGKPAIWPCNIKDCPHEKAEDQNRKDPADLFSSTGSGLAQIGF